MMNGSAASGASGSIYNDIISNLQILVDVYRKSHLPIMCLGLIGNTIGFYTLLASQKMRNSHFNFFRVLTAAELTYTLNYFVVEQTLLKHFLAKPEGINMRALVATGQEGLDFIRQIAFFKKSASTNAFIPLYLGVIHRVLVSATGYIILYMTSLIALERFIVIRCPVWYAKISSGRRSKITNKSILLFTIIAVFVNSWDTFFENVLHQRPLTLDLFNMTSVNVTYYYYLPRTEPEQYLTMRKIKDTYNIIVRLCYPALLLACTLSVLVGLARIRRRRTQILGNGIQAPLERQRSIFYLMLILSLVAFISVLPRETYRLLNWIYPEDSLHSIALPNSNTASMNESELSFKLKIFYYGHQSLKYLTNLANFLARSSTFYLYIIFNRFYRTEVLRCCGIRRGPRLAGTEVESLRLRNTYYPGRSATPADQSRGVIAGGPTLGVSV